MKRGCCTAYRSFINSPPFSWNMSFSVIACSAQMPLVMNASVKCGTETFVLQHQKVASRLKNKHAALATMGDYATLLSGGLWLAARLLTLSFRFRGIQLRLRERQGHNNDVNRWGGTWKDVLWFIQSELYSGDKWQPHLWSLQFFN